MKQLKILRHPLLNLLSVLLISCSYSDTYDFDYNHTNNNVFRIIRSSEFIDLVTAKNTFENIVLSNDTTQMDFECIIAGNKIFSQTIDVEFLYFIDAMNTFYEKFPEFSTLSIDDKILCQSLLYQYNSDIDTLKNRVRTFNRTKSADPESFAVKALAGYLNSGQNASPNATYVLSNGSIKMRAWSPYETISKCRQNSLATNKEWAGYIWFDSGILIEDVNATSTQMTIKHLNWDNIPEDPLYLVHTHPNVVSGNDIEMSDADKATFSGMQDHISFFVILAQNGAKKFYTTTDAGIFEQM